MTKRFLISYDLDKPGQDYPRIWTELARLGARRVLYSQWVLRSPRAAMELVNYFKEFIDANDRLLVVSLEDDWASWQGMININDLAA